MLQLQLQFCICSHTIRISITVGLIGRVRPFRDCRKHFWLEPSPVCLATLHYNYSCLFSVVGYEYLFISISITITAVFPRMGNMNTCYNYNYRKVFREILSVIIFVAMVPGYPGTRVPRYLGTRAPGYPGIRVPGTGYPR